MLPCHARMLNAMPAQVVEYVDWYFDCEAEEDSSLPSERVAAVGADQADVVLALLVRADEPAFRAAAEAMVGRRILRCPPCLRGLAPPPERLNRDAEDRDLRKITWVARNERLPTTGAWYRFRIFRPGMTISSFLCRGGRRRDVSHAIRRGLIRVENWGAWA